MIITRLPSFLQCFFRPLRSRLSDDQFRHLWSFVLALVVHLRSAKLLHLSNLAPAAAGHRTRHGALRELLRFWRRHSAGGEHLGDGAVVRDQRLGAVAAPEVEALAMKMCACSVAL